MVEALDGIRILELTRTAPGALCTRMLADMGAEVVKVETPGRSSNAERRKIGWSRIAFDRNKKSIIIDLSVPKGCEIFQRLACTADVIVEGFRPGVSERMRADYKTISTINPSIIYCSLSGYGQTGPYRDLPGHDLNYVSVAGVIDFTGERHGRPAIPSNLIGDYASASLHGTIGILIAIIARQKTGRGQHVDVSFLDGVLNLISAVPQVASFLASGRVSQWGQGMLEGAYPYYGFYKTKDDRYIALACIEHHFWDNLCVALDRPDLAPYKSSAGHFFKAPDKRWESVRLELEEIFRKRTRDEWFSFLSRYDIPVSKVNNITEALDDSQCRERMIEQVNYAGIGKIKQMGVPIKYSNTPGRTDCLAPYAGQHSRQILSSAGYTRNEIESFVQEKVIE